MNIRFVIRQIGLLLCTLSGALVLLGLWSEFLVIFFGDDSERGAVKAFALSAAIGLAVGGASIFWTRGAKQTIEKKEAMLLVSLSWLIGAALAALPYLLWAHISVLDSPARLALRSPVNCYFESMSGLTTVGATILTKIETLPRSILLWRALTQWIGGLGIVVLFVAILPSVGAVGKRMFSVETGNTRQGVLPEVRHTARVLWVIYASLTAAQVLALRIAGMNWFESICHSLTSLATGGFSTRDASAGGFESPWIHWIIIVFMLFGGMNFALYYHLLRRRWSLVYKDTELRLYVAGLAVVTVICTLTLVGQTSTTTAGLTEVLDAPSAITQAAFQTATIQTTTGFATADFNQWPLIAKSGLVFLMFVGGCSGSTSGGIKVIRVWIVLRAIHAEIERTFRPSVVRPLRVGGHALSSDAVRAACVYTLAALVLWIVGTAGLIVMESGNGITFETAATATIVVQHSVGPGLGRVGAIETYAWLSDPSKLMLCLWMLFGRLEIFALLVLASRRFWRE